MERNSHQPVPLSLHISYVHKSQALTTRSYAFFHSSLILSIIFFRLSSYNSSSLQTPFLPWLLLFSSELIISFLSLTYLANQWRPVYRKTFPERLPSLLMSGEESNGDKYENELPPIDVFVFTADLTREPALEVMNTVISAMALDYPTKKLAVYLSDDGGSSSTLRAAEEALRFARWWIPFCKKFKVISRCPKAYFSGEEDQSEQINAHADFDEARRIIEKKYKMFEDRVREAQESDRDKGEKTTKFVPRRPPIVKIISDSLATEMPDESVPLLVYVSREKNPSYPHHFKSGAVNVLLRVSSIISNSPYILMLDCDMYCNDPSSARRAMCFLLDPQLSPSLAFVQFPQKFHNVSTNDIYAGQLKNTFDIKWPGLDGLNGPMLSGTCFYMKRKALYDLTLIDDVSDSQLKQHFGPSSELIKSLKQSPNQITPSVTLLAEANFLASCTYEQNTNWGKQVGFLYGSVLEDYFTGFALHCRGWKSVYCYPSRPAFLGSATTSLNDALVQNTRWQSGLLDVTLSRYFPLTYGLFNMSLLQSLCYASLGLQPFYSLPLWCLATVPQLCLLHGIQIYPKVSSPWFAVFLASFACTQLKHMADFLMHGCSIEEWYNENRMWTVKAITSALYATIDAVLKKAGLRQASFTLTNKAGQGESQRLYEMGKFDFRVSSMFIVPLVVIMMVNAVCVVVGIWRLVVVETAGLEGWDRLFGQVLLSSLILVVGHPVMEGMFVRQDRGRIALSVTVVSALFSVVGLVMGSVFLVGLEWNLI